MTSSWTPSPAVRLSFRTLTRATAAAAPRGHCDIGSQLPTAQRRRPHRGAREARAVDRVTLPQAAANAASDVASVIVGCDDYARPHDHLVGAPPSVRQSRVMSEWSAAVILGASRRVMTPTRVASSTGDVDPGAGPNTNCRQETNLGPRSSTLNPQASMTSRWALITDVDVNVPPIARRDLTPGLSAGGNRHDHTCDCSPPSTLPQTETATSNARVQRFAFIRPPPVMTRAAGCRVPDRSRVCRRFVCCASRTVRRRPFMPRPASARPPPPSSGSAGGCRSRGGPPQSGPRRR